MLLWGNSVIPKLVKTKDAAVLLVDKIWATPAVRCVGYSKSSSVEPVRWPVKPQQVKNESVLLDLTSLQKI